MQFTSKIALLTVALFGVSALALPFALDGEHDVEAREIDNDLLAREFHDMYLEARVDPPLNARDFEALEFEARDHLDYLEAREAAHGSLIPKWASNLYFSKPGRYEEALEHPYNLFHKAAEDKLPVMKGIRGGHVP